MVKDTNTLHLAQEIFQILKRLPHLRLNVQPIDDLTRSEHELLVILRMNSTTEKTLFSASEIISLLQISPAGGTHLFNPLIRAGYIERMQDPRDRRVALIGLTEKGMETTDALLEDVQEQVIGLIDYLGEEASNAFIQLFSKVIDYLASQMSSPIESQHGG